MPSFFLAMARLIGHGQNGHDAYLNGRTRTTGWWYYFPELLLVKSPLGFLIALMLAFCAGSWRGWPMRATLIPAAVFLAPAMAGRIDIGIRHILPLIPLLYLFTAWRLMRPGWVWALVLLIGASAVETAAVHPDYLSFFNVAAGGPSHGDRYALDSNLDWNQDVIRLAQWLKTNADGRPYAIRLSGQRNKPLLRSLGLNADALDAPPHGGFLCISKNVRRMIRALPWLANHQPIAHIGYSIDVYDLSAPPRPDEPDDVPIVDDPSAASPR